MRLTGCLTAFAATLAVTFGASAAAQAPPDGQSVVPDSDTRELLRGFEPPTAPPIARPPVRQSALAPPVNSYGRSYSQSPASMPQANAFSAPASSGSTMVRVHAPPPKQEPEPVFQGGVTVRDLHMIGQHDVAIIVDKSGSMSELDCPAISPGSSGGLGRLAGLAAGGLMRGGVLGAAGAFLGGGATISRWDFVREQTLSFSRQAGNVLPQGITLVLFSSGYHVFPNVDVRQIPRIFAENRPGGFTNTTAAVGSVIGDYFARRDASGGHVKPLLIAVITDGMPTNPHSLRRLLIETTHHMRSPGEITITFLQIGTERRGFELLKEFDDNLMSQGARFDIVDTKTFPEVVHVGLTRALVDAVREAEQTR